MDIKKNLGSVEKVCLTVLVDNKADLIVESSEQVKYFTDVPLLAEHGFSVLIQPKNHMKLHLDVGRPVLSKG